MFSIEHGFDATVITLVDEGEGSGPDATPPAEDVVITAFEECVTLSQTDARSDRTVQITLTQGQLRDLAAALNLPEGVYRRERG
ncbi:hypothetical protein MWU52_16855 [Jannaschia sp. S6380]|uniref:hypothetical protein n=1 Tax=Jannaschia sp. S6380 TaxID=2926408 RepID=UPI001FF11268|nr:hypothetical protein [Jannaschia sp. S6380]MCK0169226.1 hypothetical protein [Jannaschia sp. S6380]